MKNKVGEPLGVCSLFGEKPNRWTASDSIRLASANKSGRRALESTYPELTAEIVRDSLRHPGSATGYSGDFSSARASASGLSAIAHS